MTLSREIRTYTLALLYLLLSAFIIAGVSYIAQIIPEYTLTASSGAVKTSSQYKPAQLVVVKTAQDENRTLIGSSQIYYKNITLNPPDAGRAWLIVFPTPSANITVYVSNYMAKHTSAQGNTYILWRDKITEISIYLSTTPPPQLPLKIYSVDSNVPIPPPSQYLNPPPQENPTPTVEISNRLIIIFTGWITGIILAIIALGKLRISI